MRELGPMRGKGNNKRGFTLAEMAIALVISLIPGMNRLVKMIKKKA